MNEPPRYKDPAVIEYFATKRFKPLQIAASAKMDALPPWGNGWRNIDLSYFISAPRHQFVGQHVRQTYADECRLSLFAKIVLRQQRMNGIRHRVRNDVVLLVC